MVGSGRKLTQGYLFVINSFSMHVTVYNWKKSFMPDINMSTMRQ